MTCYYPQRTFVIDVFILFTYLIMFPDVDRPKNEAIIGATRTYCMHCDRYMEIGSLFHWDLAVYKMGPLHERVWWFQCDKCLRTIYDLPNVKTEITNI